MMSKEDLKLLLDFIKKQEGMSPTDIAVDMGYKKNYISEMLSPTGKITDKFITRIKWHFHALLGDKMDTVLENLRKSKENGNQDEGIQLVQRDIKVIGKPKSFR